MSQRYSQLNLADRRRLHHFVERKVPINEMARQLGRHRSTIFREIRRNTFVDREMPDLNGYYCMTAHDMAYERRAKLRKLSRSSAQPRHFIWTYALDCEWRHAFTGIRIENN